MRIAILTQPLRTNFGGILQNYALQTVLRQLGHEPITIDYACRYTQKSWILGEIKALLLRRTHHIQFPHFHRGGQENLNRFIHDYIRKTKPVKKPTAVIVKHLHPDVILIGSDQVWSPLCNVPIDFLGNMFLDFLENYDIHRVAYAASFGSGDWIYTNEQTERCSKLAQKFDAISVREQSGMGLCAEYLHVKATQVLDPTLLLSAKHYAELCKSQEHIEKNNILFAYLLDITPEKKAFLERIAIERNLKLEIKGANDDLEWNDSIEQWLTYIKNAQFVITDSFHGTVFSILFHREFLSIINNKRGADRFFSLLNLLGLQERAIEELDKDKAYNWQDVNWAQVDIKLNQQRLLSMNFITGAL